MKILVTGGAGFVGSHLVDELIKKGEQVVVYDNFSTGRLLYIKGHLKNPNFKLIKADLFDEKKLKKSLEEIDFVYHLAAHADVRSGMHNHQVDIKQNLLGTHALLEAMYEKGVKKLAFASTSSVYAGANIHPTPENYPLNPTSLYAASKLSAEAFIRAYSSYYGWQVFIFRFIPFIGERYTHGMLYDLTKKALSSKDYLDILSDGTPKRSAIYVKDALDAIFKVIEKGSEPINLVNIATDELMTVDGIVDVILKTLGLKLKKRYEGTKLAWKGENRYVHLDTSKLKSLGWKPKVNFEEGIRRTVKYLLKNPALLEKK